MANSITDPTYIQALPNAGAELEIGHNDGLSRTDVINRPAKGAVAVLKRLLNSIYENATVDLSDLTNVTEIADSLIVPLYLVNKTGVGLAVGDVVALSTATDKAVVLGDSSGSLQQFVVARETIANDASGRFGLIGVMTVNTTGAIARGQYVRKSATTKTVEDAGAAHGAATTPPTGSVGVALTAAAAGVCTALMFGQTYGGGAAAALAVVLRPEAATFPASSFPQLVKNAGTNWTDYTLDFDQTTEEACFFYVAIPNGFAVTAAAIEIYSRQAAAVSGTVGWKVTTITRAPAEAWDTAGTTDTVTADTVEGTAGRVHKQTKALTTTGWAADEVLLVKIARDVAADTVAEDAKLISATLRLS